MERTPAPESLPANPESPSRGSAYREIFTQFGRLGVLGFGGPIALMAVMEEEFARKRRWITEERFSEMYAFLKVMPGPISSQMAVHLGYVRAGIGGGLLAGILFVGPAFLLVLGLSSLYFGSGYLGRSDFFGGMQAGALAVILLSTWGLARPYRKRIYAWTICALSAALVWYAPRLEPVVILAAGVTGVLLGLREARRRPRPDAPVAARQSTAGADRGGGVGGGKLRALLPLGLPGLGLGAAIAPLLPLIWMSFKAGAFVFGSGLAIVPLLEGDAVRHNHWLTHSQFMDGLALGQVTPGPVVITVTFIGYKVGGVAGAILATAAIFAPSFFNVLVLIPRFWSRFMGSPAATGFARWAIPAVIGGILGTTVRLAGVALDGGVPLAVFGISVLWMLRWNPPAWLLIPASGVLTGILQLVFGR